MFPGLPPPVFDAQFAALVAAMRDGNPGGAGGNNPNVPAGCPWLGQFVDHDTALDTTPRDQQRADPPASRNFRSPALDLDSLHGQGRGVSPGRYARDAARFAMQPNCPRRPPGRFTMMDLWSTS